MKPDVWLIGAGGLLGRAVARTLRARGITPHLASVRWNGPDSASDLAAGLTDFLAARDDSQPWLILWCAGAGVTGTPQHEFDREVQVFKSFLADLAARLPDPQHGIFYYTSSVGAVYSGAEHPPYTEFTLPVPLAPYGYAKISCENAVAQLTEEHGISTWIGRISTLYGPGQNLAKPQGLVSVLIKNYLQRKPTQIYVPLDTLRDYIFVDDAAGIIVDASWALLGRARRTFSLTKIIAAQRADTIGALLSACQMAFKTKPNIVLGASPLSAHQVQDLRVKSRVWPELDLRPLTPLPIGLAATLLDMRLTLQREGTL
ncbi:NAD(P)-dependent oxidoreductase [Micrococcales bacterium 31B]|nr:NAD(P)-dependent oxidoreductase [Micrococcales bacterium 31B]